MFKVRERDGYKEHTVYDVQIITGDVYFLIFNDSYFEYKNSIDLVPVNKKGE